MARYHVDVRFRVFRPIRTLSAPHILFQSLTVDSQHGYLGEDNTAVEEMCEHHAGVCHRFHARRLEKVTNA